MKLLKLTVTAAVSGLFVGAGTVAYAIQAVSAPTYTYVFTANPDNEDTSFDGSTITIQDDAIISWDLLDAANGINMTTGETNATSILSARAFQ